MTDPGRSDVRGAELFPLGFRLGRQSVGELVRLGLDVHVLPEDLPPPLDGVLPPRLVAAVWRTLAGGPTSATGKVWDRGAVRDTLASADGAVVAAGLVDAVVEVLLTLGLASEFDPASPAAEDEARRLVLRPLLSGHGNTHDDPDHYGVGTPGRVRAWLPPRAYDCWELADAAPSVWDLGRAFAASPAFADLDSPLSTPAGQLPLVWADVRTLLVAGAAHLDLAQPDRMPQSDETYSGRD